MNQLWEAYFMKDDDKQKQAQGKVTRNNKVLEDTTAGESGHVLRRLKLL